jgi:hypothetical protein
MASKKEPVPAADQLVDFRVASAHPQFMTLQNGGTVEITPAAQKKRNLGPSNRETDTHKCPSDTEES